MRKYDNIEISQTFNGVAIDTATEIAKVTGKSLLEQYLDNEMKNPNGMLKLLDTKKGLVVMRRRSNLRWLCCLTTPNTFSAILPSELCL